MVLNELNTALVITLVVFVGNVPSQGSKLSSFLHGGVQERNAEQHGLPLRHVGDFKLFLSKIDKCRQLRLC